MDTDSGSHRGFVPRGLPWLIAGAALLAYLLTLGRFVNYRGVEALAQAAGWDWHPVYIKPLHFLLTYPIRWLPGAWQVAGLNLFAAICASLTLALLARSVALLPHDRTRDQRQLERSDYSLLTIRAAWLPPLLAALVCGLQLTFWECAVVETGQILDLLFFAYAIRCLLEYRVAERESWLLRLSLVYGLGIANNFAMIAFFPAFLAAAIWIKGASFFHYRFCARMLLCLVAGLSLYLALPALQSFSDLTEKSFWEALRVNLSQQKFVLLHFPRYLILMLGLTSLLPILFMGIKWPASFGDISAAGTFLTNVMTHVIHGVFLLACLYVAFDPAFSPRQMLMKLKAGMTLLPFYYLGALSAGYFSGYFLLVFGATAVKPWERPSLLRALLHRSLVALVWLALLGVPVGLVKKNLPQIRRGNAPDLASFGLLAAQSLPPQGAVVLSDDPLYRLYALQAALAQSGDAQKHVLVDTASLAQPAYHRYLARRYPQQRWPNLAQGHALAEQIDASALVQVLKQVGQTRPIYYLHPSFGYYFEHFYLTPHHLVYQMQPYPTNSVASPILTADEINDNDAFWKKTKSEALAGLIQAVRPAKNQPAADVFAAYTVAMYSRALNYFGVELERSGQLEKAAEYFAFALELNPDNPAAFINQDFNRDLRAGRPGGSQPSEGAVKRLAAYGGNWDRILGENGPIEEPVSDYFQAKVFAQSRNFRQAAQQLSRILFYLPEDLETRVALANMYVQMQLPDRSLELIAQIRAATGKRLLGASDQMSLLQSEAWAYAGKNELATAEKIVRQAQEQFPQEFMPFAILVDLYLSKGRPADALAVLENQLKFQPRNVSALINVAVLKMQLEDYAAALPSLNRALELDPQNPYGLINRAIANLQAGKLDAALLDYELLERVLPKPSHVVAYGLAEIARQKKERKKALEYYESYLKRAPAGAPEIPQVHERIKKLKSGSF